MHKRYLAGTAVLALALGLLSGCSDNSKNEESKATDEGSSAVSIAIDQSALAVQSWKMDNSHVVPVAGKVLSDGQPVSGVEVNLAGKRNVTTSEDGSFEFMVDRSIPQTLSVSVTSAEQAAIAGKSVGQSAKTALLAAKSSVDIYYPVQVVDVKASANDPEAVEVHARAVVEEGQDFPVTALYNYAIRGTVKAADGSPVKDAIVSFVRDNGEGWSRSEPSNDKGEYVLYYSPEEDEDLSLNVHVGETKYSLPENRVYRFPEDTSVQTDITLPAEGNIITDKPPTLVSQAAEGAVYWSVMIGVNADSPYTVTLPDKDGSFVLTISKKAWEQAPSFFETRVSRFLLKPIAAGDTVSSADILLLRRTNRRA
ncbi:carboxypeptidase-like regulatory domain-containing protein [Cohnella faecalis]|uniref:Carboxypeptidase regulatory-like domain-containing protein n=1 Tax=Cohnella faecalis TaxID=2315694 RepID=A0A398CMK1_9BACL|nr:carboxypeptidase-like regulatory domain-containing protein [Cohnella faecalis]RIE03685.1 hypothetical protein D3H35_10325 [Cohnella faecalis]